MLLYYQLSMNSTPAYMYLTLYSIKPVQVNLHLYIMDSFGWENFSC